MTIEKKQVFLIAPSGNIEKKNLELSKKVLNEMGFKEILYRKDILSEFLGYAGNYQRRAREINEAYKSSAKIIFTVIGGMGAIHLLPYIDYELIKRKDKIIVGFSDVTLLLNAIHQKTGKRCLHGPNIGKDQKFDRKTIDCLVDVINKRSYRVRFKSQDILVRGCSRAKIIGGNIELLGRSLGTKYEINTKNKIIFLEDYDMKSWRIYDILTQLKFAGKFNNIKGVILGHFEKCGENIDDYLIDFFKNFRVPVIMNQPIGHREPNLTIPLNEQCLINTDKGYWRISFNNKV